MPQIKPITDGQREKAERLFDSGDLTIQQVADKCGITHRQARRVYEQLGVTARRGNLRQRRKAATARRVQDEVRAGGSFNDISRRTGVPRATVGDAAKVKLPTEKVIDPASFPLPDPEAREYKPFRLETPGHWLILGDVHVPYHDRKTLEAAVRSAKSDGAVGVVLNGDTLDSHEISSHDRDPSAPRYVREIEVANQFLRWLRAELPAAEIVFKEGNHEARLNRYVMGRAPALFDLEFVNIRSLLHFDDLGVVEVADKRVIKAGKLHIIHGHEYQGGGGVNPARWLYLKARSFAMTSHFHRTSEHHARNISQGSEASWSVGCACHLSPSYGPLNEWNHGFAMVDVQPDDTFMVRNLRV